MHIMTIKFLYHHVHHSPSMSMSPRHDIKYSKVQGIHFYGLTEHLKNKKKIFILTIKHASTYVNIKKNT